MRRWWRALLWTFIFSLTPAAATLAQDATSTPAAIPTTTRASETVILTDNFDDPENGTLSSESPDASKYVFGYQGGYYVIEAATADYSGTLSAPVADDLTDSTVAVDAALLIQGHDLKGKFLSIQCREGATSGGYQLEFRPNEGTLALWKLGSSASEQLTSYQFTNLTGLSDQQAHRLELSCTGELIAGRLDGVEYVSAFDDSYTHGVSSIGAGAYSNAAGTFLAYFDNLAVSVPGEVTGGGSTLVSEPSEMRSSFDDAKAQATANDPVLGPTSISVTQEEGSFPVASNDLDLTDFYTSFSFTVPDGDPPVWDVVLIFRTSDDDEARLILTSSAIWNIARQDRNPYNSGVIWNLDNTPGAVNQVEVTAEGRQATLVVNGGWVANFDISDIDSSGDLYLTSGAFASFDVPGQVIQFSDFTVYPLTVEPEITPTPEPTGDMEVFQSIKTQAQNGGPPVASLGGFDLVEQPGAFAYQSAGVDLSSFYLQVVSTVPFNSPDPNAVWDMGIGFHDIGGNDQFRFNVDSTSQWYFSYGGENPSQSGNVTGLNTEEGQTNTFELAVSANVGYLVVNGQLAAVVPLPASPTSGNIWIVSGQWTANVQAGRTATIQSFEIWTAQ